MEMEEDIDENWLTPTSTSLSSESFIPEQKLDEALSLIDRIILGCKKNDIILPLISQLIMELLNHKDDSWKYKYIAYVSVGKIASHVNEIKEIEPMIKVIFEDIFVEISIAGGLLLK